jgi:oligosaccharide repeat unit polymerase
MTFGAGEFIIHIMYINQKWRTLYKPPEKPIKISFLIIFLICTILGGLLFHYYEETLKVARFYGYKDGPLMLWYARQSIGDTSTTKVGRDGLAVYSYNISEVMAYLFIYIFLFNLIFFNKKNIPTLFPVIMYIPYIVISAGRGVFIRIMVEFCIISALFLLGKNRWHSRSAIKIIVLAAFSLFIFLLFFVLAGLLRNSKMSGFFTAIVMEYIGTSIPGLNYVITHYYGPTATYFGGQSFREVYGSLRNLGVNIPIHYTQLIPGKPYNLPGLVGPRNASTIIGAYLYDFGFIGMYTLFFLWGLLYSFIFYQIRNKRGYELIIYSHLCQGILMFSIMESVLTVFFSSAYIKKIILVIFLYYLFVNKRYLNEVRRYCFKITSGK